MRKKRSQHTADYLTANCTLRVGNGPTLSELQLMSDIEAVLTPDLLKPAYLKRWTPRHQNTWGHCYAASEALYHMLGGKKAGYVPVQAWIQDESHWWIRTGNLDLDITSGQFGDLENAIFIRRLSKSHGGFLTKKPSKRAAEIIHRVKKMHAVLNRYRTVR